MPGDSVRRKRAHVGLDNLFARDGRFDKTCLARIIVSGANEETETNYFFGRNYSTTIYVSRPPSRHRPTTLTPDTVARITNISFRSPSESAPK